MDLPTILPIVTLLAVTIFLIVIGIQVFTILKEARQTLRKLDHILSDVELISSAAKKSSSTLQHISLGIKSGMQIFQSISGLISKSEEK